MITNEVFRENLVFLDRYGTNFWSYLRGQGATVLLASGTVLLMIVALASALDPRPVTPVWVTVCSGLVVLFGSFVATYIVYQYKKTKARQIVATVPETPLPAGQDRLWNNAHIYVPPPPVHVVTRGP
ncbi:hypothetical protein BGX29_011389 [Mortierella sp. GBA35]|nr:hypothetical protein BGX29_011389 [Mortierella sp. GBA35]